MNEGEELLAIHLAELGVHFDRQHKYAPGRRLRADFALRLQGLLTEVMGGVYNRRAYGSVTGVLADIDRLNAATMAGWRMLRFTPDQVADGTAKDMVSRCRPAWRGEGARTNLDMLVEDRAAWRSWRKPRRART